MRNHKLIALLESFNRKELIGVTLYVRKTLGETSREYALLEYIKKYRRRRTPFPSLDMRIARDVLAPDISLKGFRKKIYDLESHIEDYLILEYFKRRENKIENDVLLARVYKDRGLNRQFASKVRAVQRDANSSKTIDMWKNVHLTRLYYEYYISDAEDSNLIKEDLFGSVANNFEAFYSGLSLFWLTERMNIFNSRKGAPVIEIPVFLKENMTHGGDYTGLLVSVHEAAQKRDEESYSKLKSGFIKQQDYLSPDLYFFIFINLINLNIRLTGLGLLKYGKDMLDLYKRALKSGKFLHNNKLSEKRFLNIINRACKLEEWNWIDKFKEEWSDSIETKEPQKVLAIARAYEAFAKGNYRETLKVLAGNKFHGKIDLSLRANWLKLCSYYKCPGEDSKDFKNTFTAFLNKNKMNIDFKKMKGSKNLIKAIKYMLDPNKKKIVRGFVKDCEFLMFRSWIQREIENLKR